MANKPIKIVLDTNIFVYFLISGQYSRLDKRLKSGQARLLFSEELISEFIQVVLRPKFKKYFSEKDIYNLLDEIQNYADFIEVNSHISSCRDEKDNFLLALCVDGNADFLITGDEDLLVLEKFKKTIILRISDYFKK